MPLFLFDGDTSQTEASASDRIHHAQTIAQLRRPVQHGDLRRRDFDNPHGISGDAAAAMVAFLSVTSVPL
jgi:hypothetical protein